jgi:hypothetical protein
MSIVMNMMRATFAVATAALCAALVPAAAGATAAVPIAGAITPVSDGACTAPTVEGPLVRWSCTGATESYAGDLSSTADAEFSVSGTFNTRSGSTVTRGTETFTGCVRSACGTLEWNWHVTFSTDPVTLAVLHGRGQARITAGTGALSGAKGSFTIACEPGTPCTYRGHVVM